MRIRTVTVEPVRVSPAAAEVLVRVEVDGPAAGLEVRGRVVGPMWEGVSTVEVAYPLHPVAGGSDTALTLRAVVPEPNLWTAAAPFRYAVRVELWHAGAKADARTAAVEFRPATGG
jgi:beta-galactosidase/beta-glucuronidase